MKSIEMQITFILSVAKWFHQVFASNISKLIGYSNEFCNAVIVFIIANYVHINAYDFTIFFAHEIQEIHSKLSNRAYET